MPRCGCRLVDTSVQICEHTLLRVCTCTRVRAVCSLALRDEPGWGASTSLVAGEIFLKSRNIEMLSAFCLFLTGVGVYLGVCGIHTARGVLGRRPRGRDGL